MTDGPVEGTKLAVDGACIGVIHVPVDEVRDLATGNLLLPSKQSRTHQRVKRRCFVQDHRVLW